MNNRLMKISAFDFHIVLRGFFKCSHIIVYAPLFKTRTPCLRIKFLFFNNLQVKGSRFIGYYILGESGE